MATRCRRCRNTRKRDPELGPPRKRQDLPKAQRYIGASDVIIKPFGVSRLLVQFRYIHDFMIRTVPCHPIPYYHTSTNAHVNHPFM